MLEKDFDVKNYNFEDIELPFPEIDEKNKMPEYYVIEGDPNMASQLDKFAKLGIRSVQVLTQEEYLRLYELNKIVVDLDKL